MNTPPVTERTIQRQILAAFARDWAECIVFHVPNGEKRDLRTAAELKKDGVLAGIFDLGVIAPLGKTYWIEVKTDIGVLSDAQKDIHKRTKQNGHEVYVMRHVNDALEFIRKNKHATSTSPLPITSNTGHL